MRFHARSLHSALAGSVLFALVLVSPAAADLGEQTTATDLDCSPETSFGRRGTSHTITCIARDSSGTPVTRAEIDVEAIGANDPDNAYEPTTPDFSCVTSAATEGTCSVEHGGGGSTSSAGLTSYRAWVDADDDDSTTEADEGEGRDEDVTPGAAEPDATDVVEREWEMHRCSISGTAGPDTLVGTPGRDVICGLGGDDAISGRGGNDEVLGQQGSDGLKGGGGNDRLIGGRGHDDLGGGRGRDSCSGDAGFDRFSSCERRS